MEEITEALGDSAQPVNPPEKTSEPELTEEQKIEQAKIEFEEAKQAHAKKVVEGIGKGYEEAKKMATEIAHKTLSNWFFEKDLARQMKMDLGQLKNNLKWLDGFGMIEHKVVGPALQLKIIRKPEKMMEKLMKFRHQLMERMAQLEVVCTLVSSECKTNEEPKDVNGDGVIDIRDTMDKNQGTNE